MSLRTIEDLGDVSGQRVFVRVDFNVPLAEGSVADDMRIRAAVPTLNELIEAGASLVLASHLGRPKGRVAEDLRIAPVGDRLEELLGRDVMALDEVVGEDVEAACGHIEAGEVVLLENLRFDPREEANDPGFADSLAGLADLYVDDAFGAAHRAHASVVALAERLPSVAGRLLQREVEVLSELLRGPERPYVAVLGGAKVSDKLGAVGSLVERVDTLIIGGAMAYTFIASAGGSVGDSLVEPDRFDDVRAAVRAAEERGVAVLLPPDSVAAAGPKDPAAATLVPSNGIPDGLMGLDIGPDAVEVFSEAIGAGRTILWNGPMGVFEEAAFVAGTRGIARAIAGSSAFSVVGGGDSLRAVRDLGLDTSFGHLSTGGGASIEFLEGRELPGIAVLEKA